MRILSDVMRDARGATAIEYGLIVGCIMIVIIVTVSSVADKTIHMWDDVVENVTRS